MMPDLRLYYLCPGCKARRVDHGYGPRDVCPCGYTYQRTHDPDEPPEPPDARDLWDYEQAAKQGPAAAKPSRTDDDRPF